MRWQDTDLCIEVTKRGESTPAYQCLCHFMPKVEDTLRAGLPASPDFTLHDNQHGFRVAQLISKMVESERLAEMSSIEIVYSCFLHIVTILE